MKKETIVISGFPGVGKSYLAAQEKLPFSVLDLESSNFSKETGLFPQNYVNAILEHIGTVDIICISNHPAVLNLLAEKNIHFYQVYPQYTLKSEYLKRYKDRGSSPSFIANLDNSWEQYLENDKAANCCTHIVLSKGQYLKDVLSWENEKVLIVIK